MNLSAWLLLPALLLAPPGNLSDEALEKNDEGVRLHEKKEYLRALKAFEEARLLDPENAIIRRNMGRCILEIGSEELREGQIDEAISRLVQAVKLLPGEAESHYRLGVALYRKKEYRDAIARLEAARHLDRNHAPVRLWLARCHYELGVLDEAIVALEEAARIDPGEKDIADFLQKVRREEKIQRDFIRAYSANFTIEFSGEIPATVRDDVRHALEDAFQRATSELDYYPTAQISAILYSEKEFRDVTGSYHWVGGVYDGKIRVPVRDFQEHEEAVRKVIAHEVAHAVIREGCGDIPKWFNEGLAQHVDGSDRDAASKVAREIARGGHIPSLGGIDSKLRLADRKKVTEGYAMALSFVTYLGDTYGESRFGFIIHRMQKEDTFLEAFDAAYGDQPKVVADQWASSLGQEEEQAVPETGR
ncbi:MAG: tetratricopeptide repeat protein [Planctomycetota bacterium]|nr:tetratricopeptide repeat protein [Planctomycetota bacterium]